MSAISLIAILGFTSVIFVICIVMAMAVYKVAGKSELTIFILRSKKWMAKESIIKIILT